MASQHLKNFLTSCTLWKTLVVIGLFLNLIVTTQKPHQLLVSVPAPPRPQAANDHRTNLSHIAFGMMGSVPTWPHRRGYLEAWWRPNKTRGYVILDRAPPPELLPWPRTAPPYKIVDNISELFRETKPRFELMPRMVHGLVELLREEREGVRWVVMGDDDTVVFVENVVDVLAELDHRKYYYLGWHSESVISNFWYSFDQAFGGGGIVMSYPLAAALVRDMDRCLIRYAGGWSADWISMACIADVGVSLTPHKGIHQVDLHGDFSGYLSAHPQTPLMTFHHFDAMDPIFPSMDRMQSTRHLMKAADADQSGYFSKPSATTRKPTGLSPCRGVTSAQIYERIMPRSYLQLPIETFTPWASGKEHPFYMFNTRPQSNDSCEKPHFFFLQSVSKTASPHHIVTTYKRARPRGLPPCSSAGNHPADTITKIKVISPTKKRLQIDRCECCDIVRVNGGKMEVGLRECKIDEIIA